MVLILGMEAVLFATYKEELVYGIIDTFFLPDSQDEQTAETSPEAKNESSSPPSRTSNPGVTKTPVATPTALDGTVTNSVPLESPTPAPVQTYSAPTPKPTQKVAQSSSDQTVYITNTGSKYHSGWCQYLRGSKIPISLSAAKAQGYTPCKTCRHGW